MHNNCIETPKENLSLDWQWVFMRDEGFRVNRRSH